MCFGCVSAGCLYDGPSETSLPHVASGYLGLSLVDSHAIADAADGLVKDFVRRDLLKACGLEEEK